MTWKYLMTYNLQINTKKTNPKQTHFCTQRYHYRAEGNPFYKTKPKTNPFFSEASVSSVARKTKRTQNINGWHLQAKLVGAFYETNPNTVEPPMSNWAISSSKNYQPRTKNCFYETNPNSCTLSIRTPQENAINTRDLRKNCGTL
jgi:hypothetical protein